MFFVSKRRKTSWRNASVHQQNLEWKNVMDRKVVSGFPIGNFLPHSAENFRGEAFNVSENLSCRKILCIIVRYHGFLLKIFSLTMPMIIVGEPFDFSEKLWKGIKFWIREGVYQDFRANFYWCQSTKKIRLEDSCVSETFWCQKVFEFWGNRNSVEVFLSQSTKKIVGEHFDFSEIFQYAQICGSEEGYHVFPSETFITQSWKISRGTLQCRKF